jgi:hypothetical protein
MFKIFNETYYVDIDKIDEYVQFTEETVEETDTENEEVTKKKNKFI